MMHIAFTREEAEYIYFENHKVMIDEDCPREVRESIEKKLKKAKVTL